MDKLHIPSSALSHYIGKKLSKIDGDILLVCNSEEDALSYSKQIKFFHPNIEVDYFPSWDSLPYDRVSPSPSVLAERAQILSDLAIREKPGKRVFAISSSALMQKLPASEVFVSTTLKIALGDTISGSAIANSLVQNGFVRCSCANEPGEFSLRGEIVDIVVADNTGYRLNFAWDKLEKIKLFDPLTQISSDNLERIYIYPASEFNLRRETIEKFKTGFLREFGVNHSKNPIYLSAMEGIVSLSAENLLPLLYEDMCDFLSYLKNPLVIIDQLAIQALKETESDILDFYKSRVEGNKIPGASFYPAIPPEKLYFSFDDVRDILREGFVVENVVSSDIDGEHYSPSPDLYSVSVQNKIPVADLVVDFVKKNPGKKLVICAPSRSGVERIKAIMDHAPSKIAYSCELSHVKYGLISSDTIFLSLKDLVGEKFTRSDHSRKSTKLKNIMTELENLTEGELVSHMEHGIGRFESVETLTVSGQPHDCVKLVYADNNRLYIPVENLDVIKKYGSEDAALDKLGSVSWQKRKARLKERIGELAVKLMAVAAGRKIRNIDPVIITESYDKFAMKFPYTETDDQLSAIEDVKEDLLSGHPMDRLICGDVGFGKTEVAIRAAFLVAQDGKQVAVICPTTILCRQHYASFKERFRNSGFKVAQLSRLVSSAEISRVKKGLEAGEIDIVIGTHAILASDIKFDNLGMVIVDEEQRFGVTQKERLKELKTGVHILTLSATPIPRTLQMSLLGIRDLSFISTPPVDRLSVRTSVISYDPAVVRDALLREHFRGGRSFFVCPKIKDLEEISSDLGKLIPELSFKVAHGQMSPSVLDEVMGEFYDGKFDVLLCTTIVESGIDIPAAGTIVIHKAENFGLSQLYQLRGRVGRSKSRGYAYLTISNTKNITKHSIKRLDIMQNVDSLGAGFMVASHDMDIRGFGNLVGDEQSGHIKEVGIELYQDMLEEAVNKLRGEIDEKKDLNPSINIGLPISIPENYIGDGSLRMGLYRRVSAMNSKEELENFRDELIDRFGPPPSEVENLISVVEIKQLCKKLNIQDLDSGPNGFVIKFIDGYDPRDVVMPFILANPRNSKIRPDNKFVVLKNLVDHNIVSEVLLLFREFGVSQ